MNLKLYEIDAAIDAAIEAGTDPETGEITNLEELTACLLYTSRIFWYFFFALDT